MNKWYNLFVTKNLVYLIYAESLIIIYWKDRYIIFCQWVKDMPPNIYCKKIKAKLNSWCFCVKCKPEWLWAIMSLWPWQLSGAYHVEKAIDNREASYNGWKICH